MAGDGISRSNQRVDLRPVLDVAAREERREGQLREHDEVAAGVVALVQQLEQPVHDGLARIDPLDRPHLGGPHRHGSGHRFMLTG